MRVLVSPLAELRMQGLALVVAERLAGPRGATISLLDAEVFDLSRPLSEAEVARLRGAILGSISQDSLVTAREREDAVGYVCAGSLLMEPADISEPGTATLMAVSDHVDLTWRSPLTGPNDDRMGPRFPTMTGVYVPEVVTSVPGMSKDVLGRYIAGEGMIVVPGIVAGVRDDGRLSDHEAKIAAILRCAGASSELAPVTVLAAHLGLRVAAAVLTRVEGREMPGGRS